MGDEVGMSWRKREINFGLGMAVLTSINNNSKFISKVWKAFEENLGIALGD